MTGGEPLVERTRPPARTVPTVPPPGLSIVVGATGALGRGIVARLLTEGHHVLAVARSRTDLGALVAAHAPAPLRAYAADGADEGFGVAVAGAVGEEQVRLVVHGPAAPTAGGILEAPVGAILDAVDVKVGGLLRLVRGLGPALGPGARVVAVGGSLAYDPQPDAATSGIANAALANAVRQLNRALTPGGVTVHVVAPGPVDTPRLHRLAEAEAARRGVSVDVVLDEARAASPAGHLTRVEEVAWAVARLADPEAAALGGSTLLLDTGRRTAIP